MALTSEQLDAIEAALLSSINEPQSVSTDAGEVTMASLKSRLDALRQLRADAASANVSASALGGLRITKAIPPGAY